MYPMDYEEFLWALGDETTIPLLNDAIFVKPRLFFLLYIGSVREIVYYCNRDAVIMHG